MQRRLRAELRRFRPSAAKPRRFPPPARPRRGPGISLSSVSSRSVPPGDSDGLGQPQTLFLFVLFLFVKNAANPLSFGEILVIHSDGIKKDWFKRHPCRYPQWADPGVATHLWAGIGESPLFRDEPPLFHHPPLLLNSIANPSPVARRARARGITIAFHRVEAL